MNLIYYYPMKDGAPSNVGRNIFNTLHIKRKQLPFDELIIYTNKKSKNILAEKFKDIKILSIEETFKIKKDDLIHIPVSPFVFPNAKFFLHSFAKVKNNKLILNYHGDIRTETNFKYKSVNKVELTNLPTYLFIPSLLISANKVIVNSYFLKDLIINQYGIRSIEVIPNAIDNFWFLEDCEHVQKDENICEVFYHGRLSPEKGVELLIRGFHGFLTKKGFPSNIVLYIAGDGSQKKYLELLSKNLKTDKNIVFLGNINKETIKKYLNKIDGAIYPSIWDNFPLSILEALASANCPVFFSSKAGIYDFVTAEDSLNTFNPEIFNIIDTFNYIFENKIDRKTIESQKKFAEKYTWEKIIDHYIRLYKNTVYI